MPPPFLQKLDSKPLFYVYIKKHQKKEGFFKNSPNFVYVLTGVRATPAHFRKEIPSGKRCSANLSAAGRVKFPFYRVSGCCEAGGRRSGENVVADHRPTGVLT